MNATRPVVTLTLACTVALVASGLAGCSDRTAGSGTPGPATTTTTSPLGGITDYWPSPSPSWRPTGVGPVVDVEAADGATVTVNVGERVHVTAPDDLNISLAPQDLSSLVWFGDADTLLARKRGRTVVRIPNYDKHFNCPHGPCAHPNSPMQMTVVITPGGTAPVIPAPITISDPNRAQTVRLRVGQQLRLAAGVEASSYADSGSNPLTSVQTDDGATTYVGVSPGDGWISVVARNDHESTPKTVTVEVRG